MKGGGGEMGTGGVGRSSVKFVPVSKFFLS